MSELRFKPYVYKYVDAGGEQYEKTIVALFMGTLPIKLTDYHKYLRDSSKIKHMYARNQDEVRRVCNFLNYVLIDGRSKYNAKSLAEIPFEAVTDYLAHYATTKNRFKDYPGEQSVNKERNAICMFMHNLSEEEGLKDHYYARKVKSVVVPINDNKIITSKENREVAVWEYEISVDYLGKHDYKLVRDIPQKAVGSILKWMNRKEPELYLAVVLQMCSGLREGEVVNIRRVDSIYPDGIKKTTENGVFTNFEMDIFHEYQLRSDGVSVGHIKKKRQQQVYPPFLPFVQKAYEQHLTYMKNKKIEDTKPMFITKRTKKPTDCYVAITSADYSKRISSVIKNYVMPELIKSNNAELVGFAMSLNEGSWGPHAFRHWFTVQLVLNNEDANSIAFWRGDSSTKTAFEYLQDKGILMKKYAKITDAVTSDLMEAISEMEVV